MYEQLKQAILHKDSNRVYELSDSIVLDDISRSNSDVIWLLAICLAYKAYVKEAEEYYLECVALIDEFLLVHLDKCNQKTLYRLICLRVNCWSELVVMGYMPTENFVNDRQILFDVIISKFRGQEQHKNDYINIINVFLNSAISHMLVFERTDVEKVYAFGQRLVAYKILLQIYCAENDFANTDRVNKNILALLQNNQNFFNETVFNHAFEDLNKKLKNEIQLDEFRLNIRWDVVTLGIRLP